jgi:ParB/Sulfiredoxin domain
MDGHIREVKEIEIARLTLRYAHTRIERSKEWRALANSIECIGQIVPIIVSKDLAVLDGYLRLKALASLGHDTVMAEVWDSRDEEALGELLARTKSRPWDKFEEAALLCELHECYRLSQEKIAAMAGHTQGWVSSRITLYRSLSDDLMALILKGSISTWTATRVIVPIARALPEHGKALSEQLAKASLSTREMALFFTHYKKATRTERERMVHDPSLFIRSVHAHREAMETKVLRDGPEGAWCKDFKAVTHILMRLARQVPVLFHNRSNLDRRHLLTAFEESQKQFTELEYAIRRHDDYGRDEAGHNESLRERSSHPADQPDLEALPEHRQAGDPASGEINTAYSA